MKTSDNDKLIKEISKLRRSLKELNKEVTVLKDKITKVPIYPVQIIPVPYYPYIQPAYAPYIQPAYAPYIQPLLYPTITYTYCNSTIDSEDLVLEKILNDTKQWIYTEDPQLTSSIN
jgi:hypothetical protein